jgi:hypothetical protein
MNNAVASIFAWAHPRYPQVYRVFFSGRYQPCVGMRMQGVRGEMWPVSCGSAGAGTSMSPSEAVLRMHA